MSSDGRPHAHGHGHGHAHGHAHLHGHPTSFQGWRFGVAILLNLGFALGEVVFGVRAHSSALIADALHNLTDVAALVVAWGGAWFARRPATARFTYGLRSTTIYAAIFNAALLLLACGGLGWEAVQRFGRPSGVDASVVSAVAALGIIINGVSALLFWNGRARDVNVRGAFLHLAADAAVSLGVCLAGFAILHTGWAWLDPAVTLAIVAFILAGTWNLLREATLLGLHAVPPGLNVADITAALGAEPGVAAVHDLHVWALSTTDIALTAHLVMPGGHPGDARLDDMAHALANRFGIRHATFQVELSDLHAACALDEHPSQ
ncbi:MAG: cation diffusion facilitator family transporter [Gammaproteobacteria bacterium]